MVTIHNTTTTACMDIIEAVFLCKRGGDSDWLKIMALANSETTGCFQKEIENNASEPYDKGVFYDYHPWAIKDLIAPVEAEFKATRNYTSGSLFIVSNTLYKATASIADGENIIPDTNCVTTTLAEIITGL